MSPEEVRDIIDKAGSTKFKGLSGAGWACCFSIFWAFGKRRNEIIDLRTSDVAVRGGDLAITFSILKKRTPRPPRRTKRLTLENPHAQLIRDYWENVKNKQDFMFPGARSAHINERYISDMLREELGLKQPVWSKLFRHSLATELAQGGASAFMLKTWFDWEDITMADEYVSSAGMSTREISNRTW